MTKRVDWTLPFLSRRGRMLSAGTPGPVLSPTRERELDQPTWMRRNLSVAGLGDARRPH